MSLELRLIRHALAVGRAGNFARAAESLGLTQPTLSRSIAALEQSLGVRLFDRGPRGVEPTAFGQIFLEQGAGLLQAEGNLLRQIRALADLEEGALVVGAGPYASEVSVGKAVARISAAHPRLRLKVETLDPEQVIRQVRAGSFDLGIADMTGLGDDGDLSAEPLPPHPIHLACRPGHPLAAVASPTLQQVLGYPIVSTLLRGMVASVASQAGAFGRVDGNSGDFAPAIEVNSLTLAREIACESDALFPGTTAMLARDVAAGRLVRLDFRVPVMQTNYGIVQRRDRSPSPALDLFVATLKQVEVELHLA